MYVRIWVVNTIFSDKKIKIHLTLKIIIVSILLVASLFFYRYLLGSLGQLKLYFMDNPDRKSLGLFVSYCVAFVLFLTLFLKWRYTKVLQTIFVGALFFIALSYGGYLLGIDILILYYLVSAYAEEYLKYSSGNNIFFREDGQHNLRDLIFFCIIIGLGFSMAENLLYLLYSFINHEQVSLVNMTLGRWLISTLLHIVSTSLIAFLAVKIQKKRSFAAALIGWIIWGVWIHSLYNISLAYHMSYITIPIIIVCFFLLSYLLYQSDILYERSA